MGGLESSRGVVCRRRRPGRGPRPGRLGAGNSNRIFEPCFAAGHDSAVPVRTPRSGHAACSPQPRCTLCTSTRSAPAPREVQTAVRALNFSHTPGVEKLRSARSQLGEAWPVDCLSSRARASRATSPVRAVSTCEARGTADARRPRLRSKPVRAHAHLAALAPPLLVERLGAVPLDKPSRNFALSCRLCPKRAQAGCSPQAAAFAQSRSACCAGPPTLAWHTAAGCSPVASAGASVAPPSTEGNAARGLTTHAWHRRRRRQRLKCTSFPCRPLVVWSAPLAASASSQRRGWSSRPGSSSTMSSSIRSLLKEITKSASVSGCERPSAGRGPVA